MMIEYGQEFWGDRWEALYDVLGGNPLAAMPSLHFATSLMAAHLLSEVDPVAGAVGWTYAGTLGLALVYLGEHYVVDLPRRRGADRDGPGAPPRGSSAGAGRSRVVLQALEPRTERPGRATERWRARSGLERQKAGRASERPTPQASRAGGDAAGALHPAAAADLGACSSSLSVAFLYFVLPKLLGLQETWNRIQHGNVWWLGLGGRARGVLVRRLHRPVPRRVRARALRASAGARATRSRWPGWRRPGCSPPAARAGSR